MRVPFPAAALEGQTSHAGQSGQEAEEQILGLRGSANGKHNGQLPGTPAIAGEIGAKFDHAHT